MAISSNNNSNSDVKQSQQPLIVQPVLVPAVNIAPSQPQPQQPSSSPSQSQSQSQSQGQAPHLLPKVELTWDDENKGPFMQLIKPNGQCNLQGPEHMCFV